MHERLKVDKAPAFRRFPLQVALVDDERGVLLRASVRGGKENAADLVSYWNLVTGRVEPDPRAFPKAHACRCFSPNGRFQVVRTRGVRHRVWDRDTRTTVGELEIPPAYGEAHLSDDGRVVALSGKQVALWRADTGKTKPVRDLKTGMSLLSPSGKHLIAGPASTLYDAATGAKLFTFPVSASFNTFSPDGRSYLYTYNHRAKLWDVETGEKRESLVTPFGLIGGAVSPDHTRIAAGGTFEGVRVWEVPSEDILATWRLPGGYFRRLRFSADGSRLVVANDFSTLRLLDVATATERACLVLLENNAWVTLTPDGYFVGSENLPGRAQWQVDGKAVPFDRYAKKYDRPRRVADALRS
jgi:WD40 repeat protein